MDSGFRQNDGAGAFFALRCRILVEKRSLRKKLTDQP